jgi:hypothetical protein
MLKRNVRFVVLIAVLAGFALPASAIDESPQANLDITFQAEDGSTVQGVRCATEELQPALAPDQSELDAWIENHHGRQAALDIPVAFHVVYTTRRGSAIGYVSQQMIDEQIDVLNAAYAGHNVSFTLASVDYTNSKRWFGVTPGTNKERQMKQALNISPATTFNIYTAGPGQNLLG